MAPHYSKRTEPAKPVTEQVVGKSRSDARWFEPVLRELRAMFPTKLAQELALRANRSERICEKWIARHGAPDGAALNALVNSDVGDRVLLALTRSNTQPWARALRRTHEIAQLRRQQAETASRLEVLERGLA